MSVGIDIVGVARFADLLERSPGFAARFFSPSELGHAERSPHPVQRLAGTFAAKEAVMKALSLTPAPAWARRIEITRDPSGAPKAIVGAQQVVVSISHDGAYAVAVATVL